MKKTKVILVLMSGVPAHLTTPNPLPLTVTPNTDQSPAAGGFAELKTPATSLFKIRFGSNLTRR